MAQLGHYHVAATLGLFVADAGYISNILTAD